MFRRRTDRVYATLQDVHRRITQQTKAGEQGGGSVLLPGISRPALPQPGTVGLSVPAEADEAAANPGPVPAIKPSPAVPVPSRLADHQPTPAVPNQALNLAVAERKGPAIALSLELVAVLAAVWMGTVGLAFIIGMRQGRTQPADEPQVPVGNPSFKPERAGSNPTGNEGVVAKHHRPESNPSAAAPSETATPLGGDVLVLRSVLQGNPEDHARFRQLADQLNEVARKFADQGFKPYFGTRIASKGGLQLVFGQLGENVYGIERGGDLGRKMEENLRKDYPDLYWISLGKK